MTTRPFRALLRISLGLILLGADPALFDPPHARAATKTSAETALRRIQRSVAKIDAEAKTPEGERALRQRLGEQLGVSGYSLQIEHEAWGLSYGELAMAHGFAKASRTGKTPADVVTMRTSGMGWLEIAKKLGVKVDAVAARMNRHVAKSPR